MMLSKFNHRKPTTYRWVFFVPLMVSLFLTTAFDQRDIVTSETVQIQEKGYFYAETLIWLADTHEIRLKGKQARVKFGRNDFTLDGTYTGFEHVHLLILDGKKVPPNTSIAISGYRCDMVQLTTEEAVKKYGAEGKLGTYEITTSK